jgi:hypothetical protein
MSQNQQVKVVGANGQLSLGKAFAGQMVLIEQINEGTWIVKTGSFVPDSEKWLHEGKQAAKLERALTWADKTKPEDNLDRFEKRMKK